MGKTNHRRGFTARQDIIRGVGVVDKDSLDGTATEASGGWPGDHANGKHGQARDRKGAKKFANSRRRRKDRDFLNVTMLEDI